MYMLIPSSSYMFPFCNLISLFFDICKSKMDLKKKKPLDNIFCRKLLFIDSHKLKKIIKSPFCIFLVIGTQIFKFPHVSP